MELRVEIFKYALKADEPLFICRYKDRKHHDSAIALYNSQRSSGHIPYTSRRAIAKPKMGWHLSNYPIVRATGPNGSMKRAMRFADYRAPGLVRVNKRFYQEASQVLYAENKFAFEDANALEDFVASTKDALQFFQSLVLNVHRLDIKASTLVPVFSAQRLRRITFVLKYPHYYVHTHDMLTKHITDALAFPGSLCQGRCINRHSRVCVCVPVEERERKIALIQIEYKYKHEWDQERAEKDVDKESEKIREAVGQRWAETIKYADYVNRGRRKVSLEEAQRYATFMGTR